MSAAPKSCELDLLPTSLLKPFLDSKLLLNTNIINLSMSQYDFSSFFKQVVVYSLIKEAVKNS